MVTAERIETRADLAEAMTNLNTEAKALRRRGETGTRSDRYAMLHANINVLLYSWHETPA